MAAIERCEFRRIEDHLEDCRHTEKDGALVVSESLQNLGDIEAVMQNDTAPDGEQRSHEYGEAAGVIHGRVDLNPVTLSQLPGNSGVVSVPCDLPVRNHSTLRPSGGAAGVKQAENILGMESCCERIRANPVDRFGITQHFQCANFAIQT